MLALAVFGHAADVGVDGLGARTGALGCVDHATSLPSLSRQQLFPTLMYGGLQTIALTVVPVVVACPPMRPSMQPDRDNRNAITSTKDMCLDMQPPSLFKVTYLIRLINPSPGFIEAFFQAVPYHLCRELHVEQLPHPVRVDEPLRELHAYPATDGGTAVLLASAERARELTEKGLVGEVLGRQV